MLEQGFIEWATGQIGIAGLATFALFMLRNSYMSAIDRERENANNNRADKLEMMRVLSENTASQTKLAIMIEQLGKTGSQHDGR